MLLDNLIECGETLTETARALKAFYSSDNDPSAAPAKPLPPTEEPAAPETTQPESIPEKTYSKEEIRAMLAAKANEADGIYKVDVRRNPLSIIVTPLACLSTKRETLRKGSQQVQSIRPAGY